MKYFVLKSDFDHNKNLKFVFYNVLKILLPLQMNILK